MKRKVLTILLCITMLVTFLGCGSKSTYEPGMWIDGHYTSPWLGLRYDLKGGVQQITSDEDYGRRFLYSGVFYGDSDEPSVKDLEDVVTIEMGAYYFATSYAIWIVTEEIPDDTLTIDDWLNEYLEWINMGGIITYSITSDTPNVTIGNQTFREVKLYASSMGVGLHQDLYITQQEDRIVYILLEYGNQLEDEAVPLLMSGLSTY